jgi:hypothetical protein
MIFEGNGETRHIPLDVPHSANPKSSWYGDSVGHYEGDTLVIDTIGLNDKTSKVRLVRYRRACDVRVPIVLGAAILYTPLSSNRSEVGCTMSLGKRACDLHLRPLQPRLRCRPMRIKTTFMGPAYSVMERNP